MEEFSKSAPGSPKSPPPQQTSQPSDHNTITQSINIDIKIIKILQENSQESPTQELIQSVNVQKLQKDEEEPYLDIGKIVLFLRVQCNQLLEGYQICVFLHFSELYVECGIYPLSQQVYLSCSDVLDGTRNNLLVLKAQKIEIYELLGHQMARQMGGFMVDGPPKLVGKGKGRGRRDVFGKKNFQKIGYIVKKVINSKLRSLNSKTTSKDMSKKSIQDYLYQIKIGHRYFFDFNENHRQDMKVLRKFVRNKLAEQKKKEQDRQDLDKYLTLRD